MLNNTLNIRNNIFNAKLLLLFNTQLQETFHISGSKYPQLMAVLQMQSHTKAQYTPNDPKLISLG